MRRTRPGPILGPFPPPPRKRRVRSTTGTAVGSGQGRFRSKASGPTRRRKVSPTLRRQR